MLGGGFMIGGIIFVFLSVGVFLWLILVGIFIGLFFLVVDIVYGVIKVKIV